MRLTIQNFRRIASGSYEISDKGVTLFAGTNGIGKTSVLQGLGSLLRGPAYVPLGLPKDKLIHTGATEAYLELSSNGSKRTVKWPSGKSTSEGATALEASEIALGINSICGKVAETQTALRERSTILSTVLSMEPTQDDLREAIEAENLRLSDKAVQTLWNRLAEGDVGWIRAKEEGQRLKGEWQATTGREWGSREGEAWLPAGWEPSLDDASEDILAANCLTARQEVEAQLQAGAVERAERDRLSSYIKDLAIVQVQLSDYEEQVIKCDTIMREARQKANAPRPEKSYKCAWTGKPERFKDDSLWQVVEEELESQESLDAWGVNQAILKAAEDQLDSARLDLERIKAYITEAQATQKKLEEMPELTQVEAARAAEAHAGERLRAWQAKTKASHVHKQICTNQKIVRILSPEGLRANVLARALGAFNAKLSALSAIAKWPMVTLDPDFIPRMGDYRYQSLSESAQFRVRVVLQIAMAQREHAPLIVIDRCDQLDILGRRGLMALLNKAGIPAVIAMTISAPEEFPKLKWGGEPDKWGNRSYWMG